MTTTKHLLVPPAVPMLNQLLRKWGGSTSEIARRLGVDRLALLRAINGQTRKFSVDFAAAVSAGTGGLIPVEAFRSKPRDGLPVAKANTEETG